MNSRHIVIGAMLCLLFFIANCDTMEDVKKMESETNNLTLVYASGGGGVIIPKVCQVGALSLSPGSSIDMNTSAGQERYYKIYISDTGSSGVRLNISTAGDAGLLGQIDDSNCDFITQDGDWSGNISFSLDITTAGYYWVYVVVSNIDPGTSYNISANASYL